MIIQSGAEVRPLPFLDPARALRITARRRISSQFRLAGLVSLFFVLAATNLVAAPPPHASQPRLTAKSRKTSAGPLSRTIQVASSVPTIAFATYLGSANYRINAMALGTDGTIYVAGVTLTSTAAIDPTQSSSGNGTAFVARISNDGSHLLYFTNLGTGAADEARAIAVDLSGNAYVTGQTNSANFPAVKAVQPTCSQNATGQCSGDAFVTKLNSLGEIVYSTYFGGSGYDAGNAVAIDAAGNIYVAGTTTSTDFPVFKAAQPTIGGAGDAFVAKISADGSRVLFTTFLGGKGNDEARGIALDSAGDIFITGATASIDFPTHSALQSDCLLNSKGVCAGEAFVSKLSSDGSTILYSTYLGGSGGDAANAITVDAAGSAYVAGVTNSANFPLSNPVQAHADGKSDAFVSRLSPDGQTLIFSTYLGGSGADQANAIALDAFGDVFISGWTGSLNFPTFNPVQSSCRSDGAGACSIDSFVVALNASGSATEFATYLGGSGVDDSRGVAVDAQGTIYLAGLTTSTDFPAAKLMQPSLAADEVAGGAFSAKIMGVSINGSAAAGGNGDKLKAQASGPGDPPTACTGTTTNWLGGTGNWSNAAMWSTGAVPNSASTNVCIDDGNAVASVVTLDISVTVGTLTIDSGDTLSIANNITLTAAGNISNSGQIQVAATVNTTVLSISGTVSLSGGGTVTLSSSSGGTPVINESATGSVLTIVSNTIQGVGQIGNNGLALANQSGGIVNANGGGALLLNAAAITNQGLLESAAGTLQITTGTNNAGGTISATGTGVVQFLSGSTIQGGAVSATGGGILGTGANQTATLDGSTHGALTIAGVYSGANNSTTVITGAINNTGSIQVAATVNTTLISVSGSVTLTGGGSITLSSASGGTPVINQAAAGATLTNVNNMIQGVGQIGNNGLIFVNQPAGTVNANVSAAALLLNAASITNQGLLEATNGGVLQTTTTINNQNATITANGKNSSVQFLSGTVIQAGTLSTLNTGTLGTAANQTITLDGMAHGTLTNSGTYTGANNSTTIWLGTITNTGTFQVAATVNTTLISISGAVSLTGAGAVTLSSASGGTPVINEAAAASTLTNVNNTLQGVGQIGNNGLAVVNQGTINANVAGTLLINPVTLTNQGLLEATAGGTMQPSATINNAGGTIKVDGATSAMQFLSGTTIQGGSLSTTNGGVLGASANQTITLDGAAPNPIMNLGTFTGANNSTTIILGTIVNTGTIQVAATVNTTLISVSGAVSLTGGGVITMSSTSGGTPVINQTGTGSVLTNVSNTIQGVGQIGNNGLAIINQGTINANQMGGTLILNPVSTTNAGLLEATAGILQLAVSVVSNANGTIEVAGASSSVQFVAGATIQGGTLATATGGVLGVAANQTINLDGATKGTLTISGAYTCANNSTTILLGTINNTGAILVNATVNTTLISVSGSVTLTGGGSITLSSASGGTPVINQAAAGATLTNVNNMIQGVGQIGNNGLIFVNQPAGIVNANVSAAALLLNAASITNQGLLEATNGGVLQTTTTINNQNATITANGKNSSVQFLSGTVIQAGTLSTLNTGTLGTAANQTITLDGMAHGTLTNSGTYTGANNSTTIWLGTITNTGTFQVAATVNTTLISISGAVSLTGAGAVTLSSASGGTPVINEAAAASTLTNVNNTLQGVGQIGNNGLAVVNQGTINANVAGTLLVNPVTLTNQGLLAAAAAATLQLSNAAITNTGGTIKVDGTMSVPAGFTVNGGTLAGAGTISGSVILGPAAIAQPGDIPLPGILTINGNGAGNYMQGGAATFGAVIGGTTAGTQYSQLNLTGAANLSGAFIVTLANGFTPAAGAQFTIINAASVTGQFSSSNFPNLPPGLVWNVIYNPTSVVLVAAAPTSIAVTPANPSIAVNATLQFTATATFAGGGTQDITNSVTWASSMPTVATINSTGLATGVTAGQSTTISAMLGNVVGSTTLSVTGSGTPALTQVSPNTGGQGQQNLSLAITGQSTHFAQASTTANFGAGITVASLTINSPTSATAVINIAQSATLGARTVTLTTGNEVASLTNGFTVTALTLNSIAITPNPPPSIGVGATEQFTATGTFSDGSTQNLTSSATWVSSMPGLATISNTTATRGLATGVAAGTTTITASVSGVTSPGVSLTVTGTGPTLTSISVAPPTASVAVNNTQQFTATGHFSDGSAGPVTVNWASSNMAVATINAAGLASGVAVGGPIAITATSVQTPSISGTAQLTVTAAPPTLTSVTVAPPTASIAVNATQTFTATGHFSDGSSGPVTVNWTSSNMAIVTINPAGVASGVSAGGPITITATSTQTPSVNGTAQLTVTAAPPTLTSVTVAPPTASIAVNATQTFTATGHFSDGSSGPVTVNWTSSNMAIATINPSGVALGVSAGGPLTITATSTQTPSVSGSAQLTVTATPPVLTSITVAPPSASIAVDATQSFSATGHFSDGSSAAVTVTWTSSNNAVATISAVGTAMGISAGGPINITATSTQLTNISGTAQLTVTGAALVSIAVTPVNPSALTGTTLQFHATGTYADNSTKDLTATVIWASSNTGAAAIVAGGLANLLAAGQTTISATLGEISGDTLLTVTNAPFTLTVSPPPPGQPAVPVVAPGGTVAFGLVLTPVPGFNGTVQFACTTTNPTITCAPDPNSVTLTPSSPSNVAIVLNTFCKGTTTTAQQSPSGFGGGLMMLILTLTCGGAAFFYRRRQAWALSFAVLVLIALGSASCGGIPKGPNGPTQPGEVTVTVTASANGATVTAPPLELIVE